MAIPAPKVLDDLVANKPAGEPVYHDEWKIMVEAAKADKTAAAALTQALVNVQQALTGLQAAVAALPFDANKVLLATAVPEINDEQQTYLENTIGNYLFKPETLALLASTLNPT